MNQNLNYIDILLSKSISGNANNNDLQELESWKSSSKDNLILFEKTVKVWNHSKHLISVNQFNLDKTKLQSDYNRYLSGKIKKMRRLSFIYKLAAILSFPLTFGVIWHFYSSLEEPVKIPNQICRVISPQGHVSKCILPDGTNVWINTGSYIEYNTSSFNSQREIHLEGEAYFEVISDAEKPFSVVTDFAEVIATGTAFNVNAYPDNDFFETVLAEGLIIIHFESLPEKSVEMKPGQRAMLNMNNFAFNVEAVDPEIFSSWRNGELIFKNATLNDLIKELERIYGISFHMNPESIGNLRFRGMFSYDNNLILALEKIKKTSGVDYYIENKEVWLKKSFN